MNSNPQQLHAAVDHAIRLHQAGRVAEAEQIYRQVLQHDPNHPDALHLLGLIAHHAGVREPAVELMSRAIAVAPDVALYRMNLAKVYRGLGRWGDAVDSARHAVRLEPAFVEALAELSACLRSDNKFAEAERFARRAVELRPDSADALNAHGNTLGDLDRNDQAVECYQKALRARPGWGEALCNLGELMRKLGRYDEAEVLLRQAIEKTGGEVAEPHFNLAMVLLARGRFDEGWPQYEWRWRQIGAAAPRSPRPLWDGSNLAGRTILLHSEQGLGDSIQFIRYASLLREQPGVPQQRLGGSLALPERGVTGVRLGGSLALPERGAGRVIVACERALMTLLATAPGVDEVVEKASDREMPHFDTHCPLASLPMLFRTTLQTIPNRVPYLSFDPQRAARWREELRLTRDVKNVGLVWAGSAVHKNDRHRSCRLADFAPLADVAASAGAGAGGVRYISLQMGPPREQLRDPPPGLHLTDAVGGIHELADTAALLAELDLLISVDTAPVHLAGALARPVWTLVPFVPDFRWLLERSDSPWYPTMRLFRQPRAGAWDEVMLQVRRALLTTLAAERESRTG